MESYDQPRQHIKKQRHYFANKGPSTQGYGFSSSHLCMWELDYKESWAVKNWCFWIVVLEKTLESPLDSKEVHHKGDQSWVFIGRTDVGAEIPILWPPEKSVCRSRRNRTRHVKTDRFQIGKGVHQGWYFHTAYLNYMQSTSCEMPSWMKYKLESRFPGEISIISDMQRLFMANR